MFDIQILNTMVCQYFANSLLLQLIEHTLGKMPMFKFTIPSLKVENLY